MFPSRRRGPQPRSGLEQEFLEAYSLKVFNMVAERASLQAVLQMLNVGAPRSVRRSVELEPYPDPMAPLDRTVAVRPSDPMDPQVHSGVAAWPRGQTVPQDRQDLEFPLLAPRRVHGRG